jgi:hypothetical protein
MMHKLIYFSLFTLLAISCGAASDNGSSGSSGSSGGTGFAPSDLGGSWLGRLTPADPKNHEILFYFKADTNGNISLAADSRGNEWVAANAGIEADFFSDGKLAMDFFSGAGTNKLHMEGQMAGSMSTIDGSYLYLDRMGESVEGSFEIMLSIGDEEFLGIDLSGSWSGGFGVGRRHNERVLSFELDQTGQVVTGSLMGADGIEIHSYSAGAGNFLIDNTTIGRIDDFELTADDGAIASCDFLLVDFNLGLIAGVGSDTEVGDAVVAVRR